MPKLPKFQKEDQNIDSISNLLFFGAFAEFEEDKYLDYLEKNFACNDSAIRFKKRYLSGQYGFIRQISQIKKWL